MISRNIKTSSNVDLKAPSPPRLRVRHKRAVTRGNEAERFVWDGLALVHRDGSDYLNEPFIGEIGYAFLMRSYRPENGKWQTADPMGYPDGWNQLAYCYNVPCAFVNTTDTGSPDFLRPDGNQTPQVMLGIGGAYPTYIGAVEPKFGNPATLIAIR